MIEQDGVLNSGLSFLQKPFLPSELASAVRRALGAAREPR